jgi:hypothetical protein
MLVRVRIRRLYATGLSGHVGRAVTACRSCRRETTNMVIIGVFTGMRGAFNFGALHRIKCECLLHVAPLDLSHNTIFRILLCCETFGISLNQDIIMTTGSSIHEN